MTNETDLGTDDPLNIRELIGVREAALGRAMDVAASLPRWSDSTPDKIINIAKMIEAYMPVSYTHLTLPTIYSV